MRVFWIGLFFMACLAGMSCSSKKNRDLSEMKPPVIAPFKNVDILAINDWWNRKQGGIIDLKVKREDVVAFGLYTVSNGTLKLSAQLFPLYPDETREVRLEVKRDGKWTEIAREKVNDLGWSALFRVENWDHSLDVPYRILHGKKASFEGLVRKDPVNKKNIVLAALSCNSKKDRGPRDKYVRNIEAQNPDLIFFAGDQSYDHKEHTAAWLKFGMQFRETFRNRPCISIPDDHDIGQGNLWGESGKKASSSAGNDGGYFFHPEYVKMVERCQTANLPDPYDPTPVLRGIGVYYTNLVVGGVDFAIIEDRKFKSGPKGKIPQQGPRPDHILNPDYDPKSIDVEGLKLLGDRQLAFLDAWGKTGTQNMKAVLSQTGFCGGAHLHGKKAQRLHADMDSNGWPQTGRNKALRAIKRANAVHIAGDQHLATVVRHGIDEFDDGPWAFVGPAIVNSIYSRWWWPADEKAGKNGNDKLPWTGQYRDGFDNRITMHAYANPDTDSNGAGYGLIRFDKEKREVTFECWPRNVDVTSPDAKQFAGWPVTVSMEKEI
ncbi:hypothetical protein FUAX_43390 (plasmid) [Fulvitalea axinellae]|uniref:PhoD-like phosphatase metallophosphatase domain-containing protein n=1 Tax=Fulvitalea axinellae TaxID=1182444 RepID=A0AAU9CV99_9BACT|nr:hypothetical protein FUAX_43390 [Fulvitalea axinellae]